MQPYFDGVSQKSDIGNGNTYEIGNDVTLTRLAFYIKEGVTVNNLTINPQFEEGDSTTEYEPYHEETTNIYLTEPLRKIGDYTDYIDFKSGKVVRNIKELKFDGTEDWTKYVSKDLHYQLVVGDNTFKNDNVIRIKTNYYNSLSGYWTTDYDYGAFSVDADRIRIKDKNISDLDSWKNKLKEYNNNNNPLIVDYVLRNKKEESISLPNIDLSKTKYINIETNTNPSNIELDYVK